MVRFGILWVPLATRPGTLAGVTAPKPIPYAVMVSPGAAGRNGAPRIRLELPTKMTPSSNSATSYCLPLALGTAIGSVGLIGFAGICWWLVPRYAAPLALGGAAFAWLLV